ncbi:hypothetical protein AAU57_02510 [Nonlabens sp. YIK11]|nr:hypothetical protein AAU57_02510 [Nonlabens sp. YIK11]
MTLVGQDAKIESLKNDIRTHTQDSKAVLAYADQLIEMNDSLAKTEGYLAKGSVLLRFRDFERAISNYQLALSWSPEEPKLLKGRSYNGLAMAYMMSRDFEKTLEYAAQAEAFGKKINDDRTIVGSLSKKGSALLNLGRYEEAVETYIEAARIEEGFSPNGLENTYQSIAKAYERLQRPEMVLKWYHKSLSVARQKSNSPFLYGLSYNLANFHKNIGRLDSSQYYVEQLIDVDNIDPLRKKGSLLLLADINIEQGKLIEASKRIEEARQIDWRGKKDPTAINTLMIEQKLFREMGEFEKAEKILDNMKTESISQPVSTHLPLYLEYVELYQSWGKYKQAYEVFETYTRAKDSLKDLTDLAVIQNSLDAYDLEKKEASLKETMAQNERSRYTIIWLSIMGALIIIALLFVYMRYRKSKNKASQLEAQNAQIKASFKKLQEQLAKKQQDATAGSILVNSKQVVKLDQLEYVKSEGHYLDYFVSDNEKPITERNTLKDRITELETSGFLQVHRSFVINIEKVRSIQSGLVVMETGNQIPLSRTFKQRLKEEQHPLFA